MQGIKVDHYINAERSANYINSVRSLLKHVVTWCRLDLMKVPRHGTLKILIV